MKARVVGGVVVETRIGGVFDDRWIDCPATAAPWWTYDGTTWAPPMSVSTVTPRQGKMALLQAGLLDSAMSLVNSDPVAKIEWESAQEFRRDWPLLNDMATQLGLSSVQVDSLFALAETL